MKYISILLILVLLGCSDSTVYEEYYATGEIKKVIKTSDDGSNCAEYFKKHGGLASRVCLDRNFSNGQMTTYGITGQMTSIIEIRNKKKEGEALFFSDNGDLIERSFIKNDNKYYSIFYDSLNNVIADLISPLTESKDVLKKNVQTIIEVSLPFEPKEDLPYRDKEVSIFWNFTKEKGLAQFTFDESVDSVLILDKTFNSKYITVTPRDTGIFYLNQLVYFNVKDSLFELNTVEYYVNSK